MKKKVKRLKPEYVAAIEEQNAHREYHGLEPFVIKVLECPVCHNLFESQGEKRCGCNDPPDVRDERFYVE